MNSQLTPERREQLQQYIAESSRTVADHQTARTAIEQIVSQLVDDGIASSVVAYELDNVARENRGEIQ